MPLDTAAAVLAEQVLNGTLTIKAWDERVEQWIARVNCLAVWCPDHGLAPFTGEDRRAVLEQVCREVEIPVACAGGVNSETAAQAVAHGASVVIVGGQS